MTNEKPLALGLEMPEGQWILVADGTLHLSGGKKLTRGAFSNYQMKVKRILMEDFEYVAPECFSDFMNCTEVIFRAPQIHVDHRAFAGCWNLNTVIFPEGCSYKVESDSFADTAYQCAQDSKDTKSSEALYLASSEHGARFLAQLREAMEDLKNFQVTPPPFNYPWGGNLLWTDPGTDHLDECMDPIYLGAEAKDPTMMYLAAEATRLWYLKCTDNELAYELYKIYESRAGVHWIDQMYLDAAEAGSIHALLFCTWWYQMDPKNHPNCAEMAIRAEILTAAELPETLDFTELRFLKNCYLELLDLASDADILQDEIATSTPDMPLYGVPEPNPDWKTLALRYGELAYFMVCIGLDMVCDERGFDYYPSDFQSIADSVRIEKYSFKKWYESWKSRLS